MGSDEPHGPRLGPEDTDIRGICGYALAPDAPRCQRPAEIHLCSQHPEGFPVQIASCLEHFENAKAAAPVIDTHPYQGVCGLPASLWSVELRRCVIDDSGEEPAYARTLIGATSYAERA
ncbi:MAG: hypothetical protein ACRDVE_20595 [Actinocrinis sp.]